MHILQVLAELNLNTPSRVRVAHMAQFEIDHICPGQERPQRIRYLRISVGSVCPDEKIELFLSFHGVFEFLKSDHY